MPSASTRPTWVGPRTSKPRPPACGTRREVLRDREAERVRILHDARYPFDAKAMAQLIASEQHIKTNHRGRWWLRENNVSRSQVEECVRLAVMDKNHGLPKDAGVRPFSPDHVVTAFFHLDVEQSFEAMRRLRDEQSHDPALDARRLAGGFLEMLTVDADELNVSVLLHCIHQAKRLIHDRLPKYEMVFNVLGPQGSGKTYVLTKFLSAGLLHDFFADVPFHEIADPQFFTVGSNYFTVLANEPSGSREQALSPQELQQFKAVMSKAEFNSRVFHTQTRQVTPRTFTLWSSSNKRFFEIVRDDTGQRRLFEVEMGIPHGQQVRGAGAFPYLDLWRSVDPDGPPFVSPELPIWTALMAKQETYVPPDTLDLFVGDEGDVRLLLDGEDDVAGQQELTTRDLYEDYRRFCERVGMYAKAFPNFQSALRMRPLKTRTVERRKHYLGVHR